MTLGFSEKHPDGTPTEFRERILMPLFPQIGEYRPDLKPKLHTFRVGTRWRKGMRIHMVYGNRTQRRTEFNKDIPELEYAKEVQECQICVDSGTGVSIIVDGRPLCRIETDEFIERDGFSTREKFIKWFGKPGQTVLHTGQLIQFSDFKY